MSRIIKQVLFIYAPLLLLLVSQQSCSPEMVEGSLNLSNQPQGGPSKLVAADKLGYDIAFCWNAGLVGAAPHNKVAGDEGSFEEVATDRADRSGRFTRPFSNPATGNFTLNSKFQFISKGSKFEGVTSNLDYLEIVEAVLYQYPLQGQGTLYGGLGPFIAYGIGGNVSGNGFKESSFGGQDGLKRFDAGIHLTAGYRLPSSLYFGLAYERGFVNNSPAPDYTSHNRSIDLCVGYSLQKIFGAAKKK
ncbi:MAG: hypothetical protein Q8927_11230 [Bacteroidota bacterium]|nr:hypothetical protein [Bacteroidota bacterium]